MLKDRVQTESDRQTITLDRLHFQKWRPGITFIPASDCAINACLDGLHANRGTLEEHNKQVNTPLGDMYQRGYNYSRPPYPVSPHDSHAPPPLSHPPYVYSPPSRQYTCSTYPTANSYPLPNSSPSYGHIPPQPLTHYGDPRYMEVSPREELPIMHHLPQQPSSVDHHPDHSACQSMENAALLLSCKQGNKTI